MTLNFVKKYILVGVVLTAFWGFHVPEAKALRASFATLGCEHLSQIEKTYLSFHIIYKDFSPELERRTIEQFIKKLDPSKVYLLRKDVASIKKNMKGVFKKNQRNDCSPIVEAQNLLVKRVKERVQFAKSFLGPKFKFQPKTRLVLDPDKRTYPATISQAQRFLRKYIQFQVANYLATDMKLEEAKKHVIRNYERLQRRVENYKMPQLWSKYLDAFARSLDPHSSYMSKEDLEDFQISMGLSLEGIGATLSSRDGYTVIEYLVPGGAAARSNKLRPKDKIMAVAQGENGEFKNVVEMELKDVVRLIRGPKGTKVRLKILRKTGKKVEKFDVTLVRDKVNLEEEAASITFHTRKVRGKEKKIALINLPSFYSDGKRNGRSSAKDMKKLLKIAREKKADAVVLDLSTNGGGSLEDAVKIAGLFFRVGNVVKQSQRQGRGEITFADKDPEVDFPGPLVVLTSRVSASASEIVSGTLKDYRRAVIVGGDHTFGKGSVQSVQPLRGGLLGAIKTTVGMFFTPGGKSTQHIGVSGDIVFPSIYATDEIGEKTLDYSLPPKTIKPFLSAEAYVPSGPSAWKMVGRRTIAKLRERSLRRIKKNKKFQEVIQEIRKNKKRGKALVVGEILKEKEEDKKKGEDPDKVLTAKEKEKKYLERPDIQEALNIAGDLIELQTPINLLAGPKKTK